MSSAEVVRALAVAEYTSESVVGRSRFVCTVYRVADEEAVRERVAAHRRARWDASHNCTAYVLDGGAVARSSDDGEPAGTAGAPMLEVLRGRGLSEVLAVVTRYFGGVKLGAGGLVRAYGGAVSRAVEGAGTVVVAVWPRLRVRVGYDRAGSLEGLLRLREDVRLRGVDFGSLVVFDVACADVELFVSWVASQTSGACEVEPAGSVRVELLGFSFSSVGAVMTTRNVNDNSSGGDARFPNPFIARRADPQIVRHPGGRYYFTATVPAFDRIVLRGADTLDGLREAEEVTIWTAHATGPMGSHIWAPELHWIDGAWYVYFAAGDAGDRTADVWRIRMYVLSNPGPDPLEGTWTERGRIETPIDSFSLDATTFACAGRRYLCWAQHNPDLPGTNTSLYLAELADPWTLAGDPVELSRPELPWEQIRFAVNEGPYALVRDQRVFLTYSAAGTGAEYCVGLLSADAGADLLDAEAWTKQDEPVFATSEASGVFGPGHNAFTVDETGRDVMVYHARSYAEIEGDPLDNPDRHCRLQAFDWSAEGWPVFGEPLPED